MTTDNLPKISFSDEMTAPYWNKYWDFLYTEASEDEEYWGDIYQSNCKNFQIHWTAEVGFHEYRWNDFQNYKIQVVGKARNVAGEAHVLFEAILPDNRAACLDIVKFWMTSEGEHDFLSNANAMVEIAEDEEHNSTRNELELVTYKEREKLAADIDVDVFLDYCDDCDVA